jgi:agmatine/peptidylarginine deiminase
MYGHADGMVRYIRGNIVLLNNYVDFDKDLRQHLLENLSAHFIVEELEYELPLSSKMSWAYLNFLQTEKCIFVPGLSCKEDQKAVEQIQQLYPQQKVILIEGCRDIVKEGGALNCISWNILEDTSDKTKTITNPLAL